MELRTLDDRLERRERSQREIAQTRFLYRGYGPKREQAHDREVMAAFRRLVLKERQRGNRVSVHRDDIQIRRELLKDLYWTRQERKRETGNPRYKLSAEERENIARDHGLPFIDGHILIPDREALVKTRDGREYIVAIDAVSRHYTIRRVNGLQAAGCMLGRVTGGRSKSGFKARKPYPGPDTVGRLLRGMK